MTVLYIILGIVIGVPAYLLLNTVLGLIARLFAATFDFLLGGLVGSSFMNEIKGGPGSLAEVFRTEIKVVGWMVLVAFLSVFVALVLYRFFWLVYRVFRAWFKIIKFCWNLGARAKTKIKTETK